MTKLKSESIPQTKDERLEVGDAVEVYCDHTRGGERVRDWLGGMVVQADFRMVAVQFLEEVYLTGGWMVPDHVLWLRQDSADIRRSGRRRSPRARDRKR